MAEQAKIICIGCPKGCTVTVEHEGKTILKVDGYKCNNGLEYAQNEFTAPKRVFTSTVRIDGGELAVVPVKTAQAIPKDRLFDCARAVCGLTVAAPVEIGAVVCPNICGTDVDLIATRDVAVR